MSGAFRLSERSALQRSNRRKARKKMRELINELVIDEASRSRLNKALNNVCESYMI